MSTFGAVQSQAATEVGEAPAIKSLAEKEKVDVLCMGSEHLKFPLTARTRLSADWLRLVSESSHSILWSVTSQTRHVTLSLSDRTNFNKRSHNIIAMCVCMLVYLISYASSTSTSRSLHAGSLSKNLTFLHRRYRFAAVNDAEVALWDFIDATYVSVGIVESSK